MKAVDFPIGTRVIHVENLNDSKGTVINNTLRKGDEYVAVEWESYDGSYFWTNDESVSDLMILSTILEQDFTLLQEKVAQATKLLQEADDLAKNHDKNLFDLRNDELMRVLTSSGFSEGWRSSSYNC